MEFRGVLHARLRTQNIGKVWTRLNRYPYLFGVEHLSRPIAAKTVVLVFLALLKILKHQHQSGLSISADAFFHATFRVLACQLKNKHLNFRLFQGEIQSIEDQINKKLKLVLGYEVTFW